VGESTRWLVCRAGTHFCAFGLDVVTETMRPLPVQRLLHIPAFIAGLSIIRGEPVPVVDLAVLLGEPAGPASRLITVKAASGVIGVLVHTVIGIRAIPAQAVRDLPSLAQGADDKAIAAVGLLDAELLLVLRSSYLISETLAQELRAAGAAE
jgi:purine-binding chemotaxis protein CheW